MTEWIRVRAEGIRQAEKERKAERERLIVTAAELKARLEPFWQELVGVLEESVKQFNVEFSDTERRIDNCERNSQTAVTIRRTAYPAATVKIGLNQAGTSIPYSISRIARKGANVVENQASLTIGIVDGAVGYVEANIHSHEDVAQLFLDPFFVF